MEYYVNNARAESLKIISKYFHSHDVYVEKVPSFNSFVFEMDQEGKIFYMRRNVERFTRDVHYVHSVNNPGESECV